jgi:hypothetical protein
MLVLEGNIPRFPWEPSTTMLTYRLDGTTEASASNRDGPDHSDRSAPPALGQLLPRQRARHDIFARPGEHPRCSTLLTCHYAPLRFATIRHSPLRDAEVPGSNPGIPTTVLNRGPHDAVPCFTHPPLGGRRSARG